MLAVMLSGFTLDGLTLANENSCNVGIGADENDGCYTEKPELTVHFLDVGQGDAIIIVYDGIITLIDTGERQYADMLIEYIENLGFSRIDILVGTHPHSDHIGGMAAIIRKFEIGEIFMPYIQHNTRTFENTLDAIIENDLTVHSPSPGSIFTHGCIMATVISPHRTYTNNLNNNSIVIKIEYDDITFLFMGDAEWEAESDILDSGLDVSACVIKIGHHGSATSTTEEFLSAVMPQIAIIAVGGSNQYKHPSDAVIDRLDVIGAEAYRTDIHGTIIITTNGQTLDVYTVPNALATALEQAHEQYVGNVNYRIFHLPSCSTLPAERNRVYFISRETAVDDGFVPCQR